MSAGAAAEMVSYTAIKGAQKAREEGTNLIRAGRYSEAVAALQQAIATYPDDAASWRLLGMAQGSAGDLTGAVRSLQRSVELAPDLPQGHYNLAVALHARGDAAGARRHADLALGLDPQYAMARNLLTVLSAPPIAEVAEVGAA